MRVDGFTILYKVFPKAKIPDDRYLEFYAMNGYSKVV